MDNLVAISDSWPVDFIVVVCVGHQLLPQFMKGRVINRHGVMDGTPLTHWRPLLGSHDVGSQISFLAAAMLAYEPARKLASFRVQFERNVVNAKMLFELQYTLHGCSGRIP